jgi:sporulation protein YlmC with PRC-barrel domain
VRVYRLVGSKVVGPDGQTVGKVEDLLLDRDQKLAGVIVSVGGFLGVGSKSVALPPDRVDISKAYGDERVVKIRVHERGVGRRAGFQISRDLEGGGRRAGGSGARPAELAAGIADHGLAARAATSARSRRLEHAVNRPVHTPRPKVMLIALAAGPVTLKTPDESGRSCR